VWRGYGVPGMILFQAYNVPRGVTFEVHPLSSYALNAAATVENIFGTPVVEYPSATSLFLDVFSILKS